MLQLPDNCAIFTFWDSFTLLKAGENIKTIELPRRVESCLYAGIARRTGGWSAKDAYINKGASPGAGGGGEPVERHNHRPGVAGDDEAVHVRRGYRRLR